MRELRNLGADETLLVQSGKPVGVFRTHAHAPRVLIANSNLVGRWATWEHFRELERRGLMMYGQMTAGSWIYIGSQGIVQGTYETLGSVARKHFGGNLRGRFVLTSGLGGMGGAQPLAATMAGASMLAIECRPERIAKRLQTRYLDIQAQTLEQRDLRIVNSLYLELALPLPEKEKVQVTNPGKTLWEPSVSFSAENAPLRLSPAIHVNQTGYLPGMPKRAMVGYFAGSIGELDLGQGPFEFKVLVANSGCFRTRGKMREI